MAAQREFIAANGRRCAAATSCTPARRAHRCAPPQTAPSPTGSFAETKEVIGGFDVIECADIDEAVEIASKHPIAKLGMIEVRPFWTG
jgi:hypothetical protein